MNLQFKSNEKLVQHRFDSYVIFSQICTCRDISALQNCGLGAWTFLCNVYPIYLSTLESWVLKAFGKWVSGSKYSRRVRCNVNKKRKCDWQTRQILTARSEEQYQVWISFLYSVKCCMSWTVERWVFFTFLSRYYVQEWHSICVGKARSYIYMPTCLNNEVDSI